MNDQDLQPLMTLDEARWKTRELFKDLAANGLKVNSWSALRRALEEGAVGYDDRERVLAVVGEVADTVWDRGRVGCLGTLWFILAAASEDSEAAEWLVEERVVSAGRAHGSWRPSTNCPTTLQTARQVHGGLLQVDSNVAEYNTGIWDESLRVRNTLTGAVVGWELVKGLTTRQVRSAPWTEAKLMDENMANEEEKPVSEQTMTQTGLLSDAQRARLRHQLSLAEGDSVEFIEELWDGFQKRAREIVLRPWLQEARAEGKPFGYRDAVWDMREAFRIAIDWLAELEDDLADPEPPSEPT